MPRSRPIGYPVHPRGVAAFTPQANPRLVTMGPPAHGQQSLGAAREPMLELLKGVVDRGTGRAAALDGLSAGKTGTSQNYRDAWFVGFNEQLIVGVWMGNDDRSPMDHVTGGSLPASIWRSSCARPRRWRWHESSVDIHAAGSRRTDSADRGNPVGAGA